MALIVSRWQDSAQPMYPPPGCLLITRVCHLERWEDETGLLLLDPPASTDGPLVQADQFPNQEIKLLKCTIVAEFGLPVGEVNSFHTAVRYTLPCI